MSITTGLVSVTFRKLPPARIITLTQQAGLDAIEWAGDVHVPPGDLAAARDVAKRTRDAGLITISYGSYYKAGTPAAPFETIVETAATLGARNIRIWAGEKGSRESTQQERLHVCNDIHRAATLAQFANITLSLERHDGTLTDATTSTLTLLNQLNHPNLFTYWQPALDLSHADALAELNTLLPRLSAIHVFHWIPSATDRLRLVDGITQWRDYLSALPTNSRIPALMEFVQDDSEEVFLNDARVFKDLVNSLA
jgi:sugar phosphate isomerase/epimerase